VVCLQANFLKFAGSLGVLPHREVIDVLLERAEHLAAGFDHNDSSTVLKAVAGWGGAGTTKHGAALMEALQARLQASSAPARFTRIGWPTLNPEPWTVYPEPCTLYPEPHTLNPEPWPGAAASHARAPPRSAAALSHPPMMSEANLTSRLKTSKSASEICRLGGHIKDMNHIHLNVGAAPKNCSIRP